MSEGGLNIKTVIYIDVLLLVNFLVALFLLLAAGLLCNQSCPIWRLILGGGGAAFTTLILLAPELPIVAQFIYQALSAGCVVKISYWSLPRRQIIKLTAWYSFLNLFLTGSIILLTPQSENTFQGVHTKNLSIYLYISPSLLIGCVIGTYIVLKLFLFCFSPSNTSLSPLELTVFIKETAVSITAFYDTGFHLRDPFSNKRVLLLSIPSVAPMLPKEWTLVLNQVQNNITFSDFSQTSMFSLRFLPCTTIAGQELLPAICADSVLVTHTPKRRVENILVAFCKESSFCNGCDAIFGTDLAADLL